MDNSVHDSRNSEQDFETFEFSSDFINVRTVRKSMGMTQLEFATAFGLALGSVRRWEQAGTAPDASISSYLKVIQHAPEMVQEALDQARHSVNSYSSGRS